MNEAQLERRREQAARDKQLKPLDVELQLNLLDKQKALQAEEVMAGARLGWMVEELGATTTSRRMVLRSCHAA